LSITFSVKKKKNFKKKQKTKRGEKSSKRKRSKRFFFSRDGELARKWQKEKIG
jgi:hypothetical protein